MLIDLTRRPIRLTFEECPTVVVIRTLRLRARAGGLLHHEDPDPKRSKVYEVRPAATRLRGNDEEYIETILAPPKAIDPDPDPLPPPGRRAGMTTQAAVASLQYAAQRRPLHGRAQYAGGVTHLYTVTGYSDQILKNAGIWRINLVFDQGPKGTWLLTILDETNGQAILTVNVPIEQPAKPLFPVRTPLQRLVVTQAGEAPETFWDVLRNEDA